MGVTRKEETSWCSSPHGLVQDCHTAMSNDSCMLFNWGLLVVGLVVALHHLCLLTYAAPVCHVCEVAPVLPRQRL